MTKKGIIDLRKTNICERDLILAVVEVEGLATIWGSQPISILYLDFSVWLVALSTVKT